MELVYIELNKMTPDPSYCGEWGTSQYKMTPFMVRLDAIDAFNDTSILVSGQWIGIVEGRKGLQEKIHAALNPRPQEVVPPKATEPVVEAPPVA